MFNKYRRTDSPTELLKKSGLLTLPNRAKRLRLKFLYSLLHDAFKIDKSKYVSFSNTGQTRHKHGKTLTEYCFKNDCLRYSFFPLATIEWNQLDPVITNNTSITSFLSRLDVLLHSDVQL
ncbi:unnamed protein product [Ixodes persulcatus]